MRWLLVGLVAVAVIGCGGREQNADETIRAEMAKVETICAEGTNCETGTAVYRRCTHASSGFRACTTFGQRTKRSAIYRRQDDDWAKVRGRLPGRLGWWRRAMGSPDRASVLAQWSGECEIQSTYLVTAATGKARPLFDHQESHALGWTTRGRARVAVPNTSYYSTDGGRPFRPGIYQVDPQTLAVRLERRLRNRYGC